jgi:hypothetical protein
MSVNDRFDTAAIQRAFGYGGLFRTAKTVRFQSPRNCQRIFKLDAQIANSTVNLRISNQQMNGTQAAYFFVNLSDLNPLH